MAAKCAFGRLFAASPQVQAVAVVQRAMRARAPADVMAELGFGPLALVGTFAVSMSGALGSARVVSNAGQCLHSHTVECDCARLCP